MRDYINKISSTFPLDIFSSEQTDLNAGKGAILYRVHHKRSNYLKSRNNLGQIFILDSQSARDIACHPSLVGYELMKKSLDLAHSVKKILASLELLKNDISILHILRGSSGYMVQQAIPDIPILSIRTEYQKGSFRDHTNDNINLRITYRDYDDASKTTTLLIPDTFATGRSAEYAVKDLINYGIKPNRIIIYGFIAIPSILRMSALCNEMGIELYSIAICNISSLANNNYDMPLYGLDESLYTSKGELKLLGSIVPSATLDGLISSYIPGMDQPGDWSERHNSLYNGRGSEVGNIIGHLKKSLNLIKLLDEINSKQLWYNSKHRIIVKKETILLEKQILKYSRSVTRKS